MKSENLRDVRLSVYPAGTHIILRGCKSPRSFDLCDSPRDRHDLAWWLCKHVRRDVVRRRRLRRAAGQPSSSPETQHEAQPQQEMPVSTLATKPVKRSPLGVSAANASVNKHRFDGVKLGPQQFTQRLTADLDHSALESELAIET